MDKYLIMFVILFACFLADAHTVDVSFITVNGKPTVEIVKDDVVFQVEVSKNDLQNLSPSEIVRKVCLQTNLCHLK